MVRHLSLLVPLCLCSAASFAETPTPNLLSTGGGPAGGARIVALAQELFDLGQAQKDALTVLAAARLAGSVALQDGSAIQKERKGDAPAGDDEADAPPALADAKAMLEVARDLAGEDDLLLSLIEDAEVEGARGRVGGAIQRLSFLPGGLSDVWQVPFYGASQSEVAIIGDGDTNLDVMITDEGGNTICFDVSSSDKMMCDFVPAENGYFYVTVQNKGEAKNSYYLLTN